MRAVLAGDAEVSGRVKRVFPVVSENVELPYLVYRRTRMEQAPAKRRPGADTVYIEVLCYTAQYTEGVELAEAVRAALDGRQAEAGGLSMRSCTLEDSEETWENDAYVQELLFNIKL